MTGKTFILATMLILPQFAYSQFRKKTNYDIISKEEYNKRLMKRKEVVLNKYIVIPAFPRKAEEVLLNTKNEDSILTASASLIKHGRSRELYSYLQKTKVDTGVYALVYGLYYMNKGKYANALTWFDKYKSGKYKSLVMLLIADCKYECLEDKKKYDDIMPYYQQALDFTSDSLYQDIIKNRFRFVRYNSVYDK
jgi:tetratricopeptide (TPR) repeat protein